MTALWYDFDGVPITMHEWSALWADTEARCVALTEVGDIEVSTVWLGMNYNFSGIGPPLIFETLVFGGVHDGEGERWPNWHAALAGHDQYVALVRDSLVSHGT